MYGHGKFPTAVIAMAIDMAKAFNSINHNVLLTLLHDIGVPPCALRLLASYLTERKMQLHHRGAVSNVHPLPGSGPQGGILIGILYNLYGNWISSPCQPGISPEERFSRGPTNVHTLKKSMVENRDFESIRCCQCCHRRCCLLVLISQWDNIMSI